MFTCTGEPNISQHTWSLHVEFRDHEIVYKWNCLTHACSLVNFVKMDASSVTLGSAIALLVLFTVPAECYRLLVVFPMVAPSHYNLGSGLAKGLAEAGHDVTIIAPFREKTIPKEWKYREIFLSGFSEERDSTYSYILLFRMFILNNT